MLGEIGGLFGWLLVAAIAGTILNYCVKFINKNTKTKSDLQKLLTKVFVKNHRYFGLATVVLLLVHTVIQFSRYGIVLTGVVTAGLLIVQVVLGIYAIAKKKQRKGAWFIVHRAIAVLMILSIAIHLLFPFSYNGLLNKNSSSTVSTETSNEVTKDVNEETTNSNSENNANNGEKTFTLDEISKYNGENGAKAYIVFKGVVYDVTDVPQWKNGKHNGYQAGIVVDDIVIHAPHGEKILQSLPVVGKIK